MFQGNKGKLIAIVLVFIVLVMSSLACDDSGDGDTPVKWNRPITTGETPAFLGDTIVFWTDEHGNFVLKIQGQDGEWRLVEPLE